MKTSVYRRQRKSQVASSNENSFFKNENQTPSFFESQPAKPFFGATETIHRKCANCEKEDSQIQRKTLSNSSPIASVNAVANTVKNGGKPLAANLNDHFKSRMGRDFQDTQIHTDSQAALSAKSINAKAYTLGNHIVFAEGQYQPDTYEGKKLLAHELVHVAQQGEGKTGIYRMAATSDSPATEEAATAEPELGEISTSGQGAVQYENKRDFANCAGVNVQGHTDANYSHSFNYSGSATRATDCTGCGSSPCIDDSGTIISTFRANPSVTLPAVPPGLNECESNAIQTFIDGTLSAHEQRHVAAFNTYTATINTPYHYHGCQSGEDAFIRGMHNSIESTRRAASNTDSAALDPFNPTIPCQCPDPSSTSESSTDQ